MIRTTLAALALLTTPAIADETWRHPAGTLIYEADMGHIAVLSFPTTAAPMPGGPADRAMVFFPGLGGNFDNRSTHDGYWVMEGDPVCTAILTAPDGTASQSWGRAQITFDRAAFPTGFTMTIGTCWQDPTFPIRADLP